jgi:hypothetical protein
MASLSPTSTTGGLNEKLDGINKSSFAQVGPYRQPDGLDEVAFAHVGPYRKPDGPDQNPSTPREAIGSLSSRQLRQLFPDHAERGSSFVLLRTGRDLRVPSRNSAALEQSQ